MFPPLCALGSEREISALLSHTNGARDSMCCHYFMKNKITLYWNLTVLTLSINKTNKWNVKLIFMRSFYWGDKCTRYESRSRYVYNNGIILLFTTPDNDHENGKREKDAKIPMHFILARNFILIFGHMTSFPKNYHILRPFTNKNALWKTKRKMKCNDWITITITYLLVMRGEP